MHTDAIVAALAQLIAHTSDLPGAYLTLWQMGLRHILQLMPQTRPIVLPALIGPDGNLNGLTATGVFAASQAEVTRDADGPSDPAPIIYGALENRLLGSTTCDLQAAIHLFWRLADTYVAENRPHRADAERLVKLLAVRLADPDAFVVLMMRTLNDSLLRHTAMSDLTCIAMPLRALAMGGPLKALHVAWALYTLRAYADRLGTPATRATLTTFVVQNAAPGAVSRGQRLANAWTQLRNTRASDAGVLDVTGAMLDAANAHGLLKAGDEPDDQNEAA